MKHKSLPRFSLVLVTSMALPTFLSADEPVTLENVETLAAQIGIDSDGRAGLKLPDEPLRENYSFEVAKRFLDVSSLYWQKQNKCFTCHTNYPYLMARPLIGADDLAHRQVRAFAEQTVTQQWPERGPNWDAEVISIASILAFNDALGSGKLHHVTRQALDRMWTVQRDDGGFDWLRDNTAPTEWDDHYGVTLALIGVGAAPDGYADTPQAQEGIKKMRGYLAKHPVTHPHQSAMLLWADSYSDGLLTTDERQRRIDELEALQRTDGGWSLASLGNWPYRGIGDQAGGEASDGYGTGLVTFALRRAGVPADDAHIVRAIYWLKSNQRANGGWLTRSQNHANHHHSISRAGSAYAIMALWACHQL